jgi:ankyrin repeat protein
VSDDGRNDELARRLLPQILAEGADPNAADEQGATALHRLIYKKTSDFIECDLSLAELLIERGADINWRSPDPLGPSPPVTSAVLHGRNRLLGFLLDRGADPALKANPSDDPPLHLATEMSNLEAIRLLVAHGAEVDGRNQHQQTPLCAAARRGHRQSARLLLELRADPSAALEDGTTPFTWAMRNKDHDMAALLLEHGTDVHARDAFMQTTGQTALIRCIIAGWPDLAVRCIRAGADVQARDDRGYAALHWAVIRKDPASVAALLEAGAATDGRTVDGFTPLDFALRHGDQAMAELLRSRRA